MTSFFKIPLVSLLLLLSGSDLHHASAEANTEDLLGALTILGGKYTNAPQVVYEFKTFGQISNDFISMLYKPLDIPALNERYPFAFFETRNGVYLQAGVILFSSLQNGLYEFEVYNFTRPDKISNGHLSDISVDDFATDPVCGVQLKRAGVFVIQFVKCFVETERQTVSYRLIHSCTTLVGDQVTPEMNLGLPYVYVKKEQYDLPESWTEGNEDYVSPCEE